MSFGGNQEKITSNTKREKNIFMRTMEKLSHSSGHIKDLLLPSGGKSWRFFEVIETF